ncbi:hypothetical protein BRARA_I01111 [Brassica rapa]|uniref:Uncharacterized protein n=1 Tax=Brassica campestris TaxID=3711 RepID=A0A397Y192_BRACM|nr:hypothetical protein BRARA_I01111 [Brassica rapa]
MVSFFLFVLFSFFFLCTHVSSADTISADFTLSGDQTISSSGGTFKMGFFQPATSSNFYIGMWYQQLPQQTIVWVANRDKPVSDKKTSLLKISNGNLVLLDGNNQTPVWSTGSQLFLCSRGRFARRRQSPYKILWNGSTQYWSSGPWNPQSKLFDSVPEMRLNYIFNYSFFSNATESYFTYSIYNKANISRLVVDVSGQIRQSSWLNNNNQWNLFWSQPRQQCLVYSYCGSFGICSSKSQPFCQCPRGFRPKSQKDWDLKDYSAGCVRKTELQCSRGVINQFLPLTNVKLPDILEVWGITSFSICGSACLGNCSCMAYAHDESSNRCLMWTKDVFNLQQFEEDYSEGNTLYLRLSASDMPSSSTSGKSNKAVIFGAVLGSLGAIALVLLAVIIMLRYCRRKRMRGEKSDGTL